MHTQFDLKKSWACNFVVSLVMLALHNSSFAAFVCAGKVQQLAMAPNGVVYFSLIDSEVSLSWQALCNVNTGFNSIEPAACKAIYALLTTASALDKKVIFWFDYANPTPVKCDATRFPPWSVLITGETGWYFGPAYAN
jgi:hypothetical protein